MQKMMICQENDIIDTVYFIREQARLGHIKLREPQQASVRINHLNSFLNFCGLGMEEFVTDMLSHIQSYMVSSVIENNTEFSIVYVNNDVFDVILEIELSDEENKKILTVSVTEDYSDDSDGAKNTYVNNQEQTKIIADCISCIVTGTNIKSFDVLIPRGTINIPVSLAGQLQADGTIIVDKKAIDQKILEACNGYIQELYASSLDFETLNNTVIFSKLQQLPYTVSGNTVFSNVSVLIDHMSAQNSPLHRRSAGFALTTYVNHLRMTGSQKDELTSLICEKYADEAQEFRVVTDMVIDILNTKSTEKFIHE